jgi:hypothetical protein
MPATDESIPTEEVIEMSKNWSKILLVSMLVVVFASPLAFGTTSRVRSLANTGDYLSDDSNVFRWYSTLPSYAHMVQAELGTFYGVYYEESVYAKALSLNYGCGEEAKWGTYRVTLLENAVDDPAFNSINPFFSGLTPGFVADDVAYPYSTTPVNKWDVAGGWEIGENFTLGVALTRSSFKVEDETNAGTDVDPNTKISSSFTTVGAGVTWSNNEDMLLDIAFTYGFAGGESEYTGTPTPDPAKIEWDGKNALAVAGRLFWDWKDFVKVVPVIEYGQAEYSLKRSETDYSLPNGDKVMGFRGGVGLDIEVNGDNTLVFAAEYQMAKWEYAKPDTVALENSMSVLPTFRLALESEITSWLTTRIGAAHHNVSYKETASGDEFKYTNNAPGVEEAMSGFEWFMGVGFNVAEWVIDMELSPETPFSLGYWLTGYSAFGSYIDGPFSGGGPVYRISGAYHF